jgi:DNA-binding CsgD family transcriptional regulator
MGGAPMSSPIACKVIEHFHVNVAADHEMHTTTQREQVVLTLLASDFIYKEIGDQLGITVETIRSHVKNICQ